MRSHFSNRLWKQALVLAILFHLAVVGGFVLGPTLFNTNKHQQIPYTVKLFEPQSLEKPSVPKAQKAPVKASKDKKQLLPVKKKEPPPMPKKKTAKPAPKVVKEKPKVKKKAVSLNSKKPKKVKKVAKKKKETEKKVAKSKARARNQEKKIDEKIREIQKRLAEKREEQYLKKRLKELARKAKGQGSPSGSKRPGGSQNQQAMIYGNFVKAKIWRNWHFPKALANRKDLEAVVTIIITKDGRIIDMRVKKYSGFSAFDRSVLKAIKDSAPLPPLPPSLGPGPEEIDIRFDLSKAGNPV